MSPLGQQQSFSSLTPDRLVPARTSRSKSYLQANSHDSREKPKDSRYDSRHSNQPRCVQHHRRQPNNNACQDKTDPRKRWIQQHKREWPAEYCGKSLAGREPDKFEAEHNPKACEIQVAQPNYSFFPGEIRYQLSPRVRGRIGSQAASHYFTTWVAGFGH